MSSVAPTSHTAQDAQDVRNEAEKLLARVRAFSFSQEVELLKSKLQEVIAAAEREVERIGQFGDNPVVAQQTTEQPETPVPGLAKSPLDLPQQTTAEQEKAAEEAAAAQIQSNQPSTEGAMTTQNTVAPPPEQVSGVSDQEPENKQAGQPS